MKKLMLVAICVMAVMMGCKNKGQTAPADSKDSLEAVIDSIIEENDTTPLPMFLIGGDGKYMHMLYWTNIEEPQKSEGDEDYFDGWHKSWELQEMFRRNAALYTNMLTDGKVTKVKFIDEVLKDPDGQTPSMGQIHGRNEIPSLCARFDYANAKEKPANKEDIGGWGMVIATDSYLNSRKQLSVKSCYSDAKNAFPNLPADIVKQLEKRYDMKTEKSSQICLIGDRYIMGAIEFKGAYKNAPKDEYDAESQFALALEVLIDSGKVYVLEQLGHYDPTYGSAWNADADGYIPNTIAAAFEGPKGLELCYTHGAPESFAVGMLFPREGKLIEMQYEIFQTMIDEDIPVWKRDIAEMQKLYVADNPHERKQVKFTKYAHFYLDYDHEWIWLRDQKDEYGAFFLHQDDQFKLLAAETPQMKPSNAEKNGVAYLRLSGASNGPSQYIEIHAFKNGKRTERFTALQVLGEISECTLNGRDVSQETGKAYLANLPQFEEMNGYFKDINEE